VRADFGQRLFDDFQRLRDRRSRQRVRAPFNRSARRDSTARVPVSNRLNACFI
jgi:hypothetical protein